MQMAFSLYLNIIIPQYLLVSKFSLFIGTQPYWMRAHPNDLPLVTGKEIWSQVRTRVRTSSLGGDTVRHIY